MDVDKDFDKKFIAGAMTAQSVLIRVTDASDGETITERFRLDGFPEALAALSCATRKSWSSPTSDRQRLDTSI